MSVMFHDTIPILQQICDGVVELLLATEEVSQDGFSVTCVTVLIDTTVVRR